MSSAWCIIQLSSEDNKADRNGDSKGKAQKISTGNRTPLTIRLETMCFLVGIPSKFWFTADAMTLRRVSLFLGPSLSVFWPPMTSFLLIYISACCFCLQHANHKLNSLKPWAKVIFKLWIWVFHHYGKKVTDRKERARIDSITFCWCAILKEVPALFMEF